MLKDSMPLVRRLKTVLLLFGSLICPRIKKNSIAEINVNPAKMGKIFVLFERPRYSEAILPKSAAVNKIINWSPKKVPAKEEYGNLYTFFKYVDIANDPALKNTLFKTVVMEDKANHSPVRKRILKLPEIRFSLEPLRATTSRVNREAERN
jgi:hypothetical protein